MAVKQLLKWSGGKLSEIKEFSKYYPASFDLYIEPFVGGGSVFFDLNFSNNVISDVHPELINFYTQIKLGHAKAIYDKVSSFGLDEEAYYFIRDKFPIDHDIDNAARFFYLRKTAFRGMMRYNSKGGFNIPWGRYKTVSFDTILNKYYEELLKNTEIRLNEFPVLFNEFNDENNFMFLDPPYDSVFTDYGYCKFGINHHIELFKLFKETKNKCLLIIGESELINSLYKDYIVDSYAKKYRFKIHSGRVGSEIDNKHLVIKNY